MTRFARPVSRIAAAQAVAVARVDVRADARIVSILGLILVLLVEAAWKLAT